MGIIRRIQNRFIDGVYDQVSALDGREGVEAPELYVAVLLLYNNVNKFLPGSWMDVPKKKQIFKMLETFDSTNDKVLNREEFREFCYEFFPEMTRKVMMNVIISVFVIPAFLAWALVYMKYITKVVPEAILTAFFLAFLNASGLTRVLESWLDSILHGNLFRTRPQPQPYPYPYPYPAAQPPAGYPAAATGVPVSGPGAKPVPPSSKKD